MSRETTPEPDLLTDVPSLILASAPHYMASRAYRRASLVAQMVKNLHKAGDPGSTPGSGRSPGGGHGNPLQYSCLENPMDRRAWRATVHRAVKSWTQPKGLSRHTPCVRHVSKHLTSIQSRNLHNPISIVHYHYFIDEDAEAEKLSDLLRIPQLAGATADI